MFTNKSILMRTTDVFLPFIMNSTQEEFEAEYDIFLKEHAAVMGSLSWEGQGEQRDAMLVIFKHHKTMVDEIAKQNGKEIPNVSD